MALFFTEWAENLTPARASGWRMARRGTVFALVGFPTHGFYMAQPATLFTGVIAKTGVSKLDSYAVEDSSGPWVQRLLLV